MFFFKNTAHFKIGRYRKQSSALPFLVETKTTVLLRIVFTVLITTRGMQK